MVLQLHSVECSVKSYLSLLAVLGSCSSLRSSSSRASAESSVGRSQEFPSPFVSLCGSPRWSSLDRGQSRVFSFLMCGVVGERFWQKIDRPILIGPPTLPMCFGWFWYCWLPFARQHIGMKLDRNHTWESFGATNSVTCMPLAFMIGAHIGLNSVNRIYIYIYMYIYPINAV